MRFPRLRIASFRVHPRNGQLVRVGDQHFNAPNVAAIVNSFLRASATVCPYPSTIFVNKRNKQLGRVVSQIQRGLLPKTHVIFGSMSRRDGARFVRTTGRSKLYFLNKAEITVGRCGPVRVLITSTPSSPCLWGCVGATVVIVSRTNVTLTGALRRRLPRSRVFSANASASYRSVSGLRRTIPRVFRGFSTVVFVKTVKVYVHTVTPRVRSGRGSPTIIYMSDAKHCTISILSKRVNKTGKLAQCITDVLKTRPIVAAQDSHANL